MRKNGALVCAALSLLLLVWVAAAGRAQDSEPITHKAVIGVLQTAFPELDAADIKIKLLKKLTSRVKVNLEIEGRNAILYLKWRRHEGEYRWWFEFDRTRSLIYLSKTTGSARSGAPRERQDVAASHTATAEEQKESRDRTETISVKQEAASTAAEAEAGEHAAESATVSKAEQPPEEIAAEAETAAEEAESGEEDAKTDTGEPAIGSQVAFAVGPTATNMQFLTALVTVVAKGEDKYYSDFLLRPGEVAEKVPQERFENIISVWRDQCSTVHAELKKAASIEVTRIILRRARSDEVEKATIERLRKTVPGIREIFTFVGIDLMLDGAPTHIKIGGLMRTDGGWRVGGRMEIGQGETPES